MGLVKARWYFRRHRIGRRVAVVAPVRFELKGDVTLGDRVRFEGDVMRGSVKVGPGASLGLGDEVVFNYGLSLDVRQSVLIGNRCIFGSFVRICDHDGPTTAPIVIEDDVWIAHGAVVHPGVVIGEGSVVAAGAVVTRSVPPRSMAIGNPARAMSLELRAGPGAKGAKGVS